MSLIQKIYMQAFFDILKKLKPEKPQKSSKILKNRAKIAPPKMSTILKFLLLLNKKSGVVVAILSAKSRFSAKTVSVKPSFW